MRTSTRLAALAAAAAVLVTAACGAPVDPFPTPSPTPTVATPTPTPDPTPTPVEPTGPVPGVVQVLTNQFSFLPASPKRAVIVTDVKTSMPWQLVDAAGTSLLSGRARQAGVDPTTGRDVQVVDFTSYAVPGAGLKITVDGAESHPFDISYSTFQQLRPDTMTWFYTQRSGTRIDDFLVPGHGRAPGHASDSNVTCPDVDDLSQKVLTAAGRKPWLCRYSVNLSGGWYDTGDYGKYAVDGAFALAELLRITERTSIGGAGRGSTVGSLNIPEKANAIPDYLDEARWELDWLLRARVPAGEPDAGMTYHKMGGIDFGRIPQDPSTDTVERVVAPPSVEATLYSAAVFAQASRVFRFYDMKFSDELAKDASDSYQAALAHMSMTAVRNDSDIDPNPGTNDFAGVKVAGARYWAEVELSMLSDSNAGNAKAYMTAAKSSPMHAANTFGDAALTWSDPTNLAKLDIASVPGGQLLDRDLIRSQITAAADRYVVAAGKSAWGLPLPSGKFTKNSIQQITGNMQVLAVAADNTSTPTYRNVVLDSMSWLLGGNAVDRSFVTGYGTSSVSAQVSQLNAASIDPSTPPAPKGSTTGGPNASAAGQGDPVITTLAPGCVGQLCQVDSIRSSGTNEDTAVTQASLAWLTAWLDI